MSTYAQLSRILGRSGRTARLAGPRVPELNLLAPELAGRRLTSQQRRLLLVGLLLLVGAALQFQLVGEKAIGSLRNLVPASFEGEEGITAQVADLRKKLDALRTEVREAESAKTTLERQRVPWGDLLRYEYAHALAGISPDGMRQNGLEAIITGSGPTSESIADYRTALQDSPAIQTVDFPSRSRDPGSDRYVFTFKLTIVPGVPVENP